MGPGVSPGWVSAAEEKVSPADSLLEKTQAHVSSSEGWQERGARQKNLHVPFLYQSRKPFYSEASVDFIDYCKEIQ